MLALGVLLAALLAGCGDIRLEPKVSGVVIGREYDPPERKPKKSCRTTGTGGKARTTCSTTYLTEPAEWELTVAPFAGGPAAELKVSHSAYARCPEGAVYPDCAIGTP
ncbi:hypothetical protein [Spongiactinospora sp. TRM90649]|uniref:hypothetical protein n=1 Tax=Spongiactinospora sp. TRM90649 TaxID=3031114 RepID=UPI0023F78C0F|nr:hypothetical protein [Spongiactinospora sp. TRM90649]MDF5756600.1 hypothetical protein [Spongiactinospora sp. TRM90649]